MPNDMYRVQFENGLAQALLAKGFEAATSASAFPPGQLDKEKVQQYVIQNGVDLVIVQRLTKKTTEEYVPPSVAYVPAGRCIELKSLKYYLVEFRNRGIFYEQATNQILDDLVAACRPRRMTVVGDFTPRGGISTAVTAAYQKP